MTFTAHILLHDMQDNNNTTLTAQSGLYQVCPWSLDRQGINESITGNFWAQRFDFELVRIIGVDEGGRLDIDYFDLHTLLAPRKLPWSSREWCHVSPITRQGPDRVSNFRTMQPGFLVAVTPGRAHARQLPYCAASCTRLSCEKSMGAVHTAQQHSLRDIQAHM